MKRFVLVLAIVALFVTSVMAETMPTLTPYPTAITYPGYGIWTQSSGYLHAEDVAGGVFPQVLGYAMPDGAFNNDYVIQGNVTLVSECEVGFIARANLASLNAYYASVDPTNNYLNIVKLTGGSVTNIGCAPSGIDIKSGDTYGLKFTIQGNNLTLDLFDSVGNFIKENTCTDNTHTAGLVGTWSFKKGEPINGTWSSMTISAVPEPGTVAMLAAAALALLGWAWRRR